MISCPSPLKLLQNVIRNLFLSLFTYFKVTWLFSLIVFVTIEAIGVQ